MDRQVWIVVGLALVIAFAGAVASVDPAASASASIDVAAVGVHLSYSLGVDPDSSALLQTTGIVDGIWVHWGLDGICATGSGTLQWRTPGGATQSSPGRIVGQTTYQGERTMHGAKIPLEGDAQEIEYRLRCGLTELRPWTNTSFPPTGDSIRIAAWADIGTPGYHGASKPLGGEDSPPLVLQQRIQEFDPDVLVIPGDLSYGDVGAPEFTRAQVWDAFERLFEPTFSTIPVMPVAGNHEKDNSAFPYHHFKARWVLPNDENHYGFRAGPVSFIAMNSDDACVGSSNPCQVNPGVTERLLAELIRAFNSGSKWIVVYFHHPVHAAGGSHLSHEAIQEAWVPLFERYSVDLVITAHDHNYQRSHPMSSGTIRDTDKDDYTEGRGVIYMVAGGGGRNLYSIDESVPAPWRKVANSQDHHVVTIEANATRFDVRVIPPTAGADPIDAFSILKK